MVPFCFRIFANSSIGTFFVPKFSHFPQMVPFLFQIFHTLLKWYHILVFKIFHTTRMVPFLLLNFGTFLKWYHFCCQIFAHSSIGTFFCSKIFALFSNGTIFVSDFSHFAQMVPYLLFWFSNFFTLCSNK